jgi:hypothetical protein
MAFVVTSCGTNSNTSGTSLVVGNGSGSGLADIPTGALIVVAVLESGSPAPGASALSDNQNSTYAQITTRALNNVAANGSLALYYFWNNTHSVLLTGTDSITYTKNASAHGAAMSVFYVTGQLSGSDPLDSGTTNTASGSSTSPSVTASAAPAVPSSLFVAGMAADNNSAFTQDTTNGTWVAPFTRLTISTSAQLAGGNQVGSSALKYNPAIGTSTPWAEIITAFKPAAVTPVFGLVMDMADVAPTLRERRSWEAWYNLNLIGKDQLPTGAQVSELAPDTPRIALRERRSWEWWYNLNLIGKDRFPPGAIVYDLSPDAARSLRERRSWEAWYNLNLIGKDRFPPGENFTDRPLPPPFYREWVGQNLLQTTLTIVPTPRNQYDWPVPRAFAPIQQTITASYNLNLIGKDVLPFTRTQGVHGLKDVPDIARNLRERRSWEWWYNLNLIGKDQLPPGGQIFDLSPRGPVPLFQAWQFYEFLGNITVAPFPRNQYDWPVPDAARNLRERRSWEWWYNLSLIGRDQLPPGENVYDAPPRGFPPLTPSWAWNYNLNLIGQDQLPPGEIFTDRPAAIAWFRDWALNLQQTTLAVVITPRNQFDWSLPQAPSRIQQTITASYNLNLIGQDKLPTGEQVFELAPRGPAPLLQTWQLSAFIPNYPLPQALPPGLQFDWPVPTAPYRLDYASAFAEPPYRIPPAPPAPPTVQPGGGGRLVYFFDPMCEDEFIPAWMLMDDE